LRAGYFMENTLAQIGIIKSLWLMQGPVRGDVLLAVIATRVLARRPRRRYCRWTSRGQKDRRNCRGRGHDLHEAARIAGEAIGKPTLLHGVADEQGDPGNDRMEFRGHALLICEMSAAINSGS